MSRASTVCEFAEVTPDKSGRLTMRKDVMYSCLFPVPEPVLPASITEFYGFRWPPLRRRICKEDCAGCPCWKAREASK